MSATKICFSSISYQRYASLVSAKCSATFRNAGLLISHCQHCHSNRPSVTDIDEELEQDGIDVRFWAYGTRCEICGKLIKDLGRHMRSKHRKGEGVSSSSKKARKEKKARYPRNPQDEWQMNHHTDTSRGSTFVCDFLGCGKQFTTLKKLKDHRHVHARYQCGHPGCSRTFSSKNKRDVHQRKHKIKTHLCMICSKCFASAGSLKNSCLMFLLPHASTTSSSFQHYHHLRRNLTGEITRHVLRIPITVRHSRGVEFFSI